MESQSSRGSSVIVERGLICRLCMGNREYSVNIFYNSEVYKIPVWNVMMDLLHVEVSKDDGLPDTVCRRCVRKLLEFKEFKELCLKSATELRKSAQGSDFFRPVKEEELGSSGKSFESIDATSGTGDDVTITALSIVTQRPLAVDNMCPVKEEEQRVMQVVAEEEIKREDDILEGLDTGMMSASNMDPVLVDSITDRRCGQSPFIKEECNKESDVSDTDLLEMGFSGFDMMSSVSGNEIESRKTYLLTLEEEFRSEDVTCSDFFQRLNFDFEMTTPHTGIERVKEEDMPCETGVGATSNDGDNCDVDRSGGTPIPNVTSEPIVVNSCNESEDFSRKQGQMSGNIGVMELGTLPNNSTLISKDGHLAEGDVSVNNSTSHSFTQLPKSELIFSENRRVTWKGQKHGEIPAVNLIRERYGQGQETNNSNEDSLEDHSKYTCDYCRITFTDKKSLCFHIEEHTAERMIHTEEVSPRVSLKILLLKISRIDQHLKPLSNGTGEKILNKVTNLATHSKAHKAMLQCDRCGKQFHKSNTLAKHRTIHNGMSFKCGVCGKEFYWKSNFVAHTAIHSAEKLFKCQVCGLAFNVKRKLVRHSRVHEKPSSFDCNSCGRKFRRKSYLSSHITIHCGKMRDGPFKCDECGKEFYNRSTLRSHRSIHSGVTFKCEFCGKEFHRKSNFLSHIVIHSEEKPFKCETCGKHFNLKSKLARHCVVHSDLRPFGCDVCGKCFKHKGYLVIHMDIHTGVKRFKCEICLKEFGQWSTLRRHSLTHNKLKAFKCASCLREFDRKCNLIRHCQKCCL